MTTQEQVKERARRAFAKGREDYGFDDAHFERQRERFARLSKRCPQAFDSSEGRALLKAMDVR